MALLEARESGLYCPAGDFHIDPALPVDRALITHAHSDHARPGSRAYLTALPGEALLRARIGDDAAIQAEALRRFHPHRRGERLLPSRRPHPRLVADPHRTRRRSLGGLRRLQTRPRPHLRALRAAALPYLRHRIHLRPADLPLGRCRADRRGDPALVARQPAGGARQHSVRLPGGQGAAHSRRCSMPAPARWSFTSLWNASMPSTGRRASPCRCRRRPRISPKP